MSLPPAKELLGEAEAAGGGLVKLGLRPTRILETLDKHTKQLEAQAAEIASIRETILTLQAREDVLLARSEATASVAAAHGLADLARRVGYLEAITGGTAAPARQPPVG